jgi:hypothetical protein
MRRRSTDRATDCNSVAMDWATLGARIRRLAAAAGAVHMMEVARRHRSEPVGQGRIDLGQNAGGDWTHPPL